MTPTFYAGAQYIGMTVNDIAYDIQPILITLAQQELRKIAGKLVTNEEIVNWLKDNGAEFTLVFEGYYTITAY